MEREWLVEEGYFEAVCEMPVPTPTQQLVAMLTGEERGASLP